ncbi:MAG: peroxiredoxin family protein [Gemmatimonadota bacterium]
MTSTASRLPYVLAGAVLAVAVGLAWVRGNPSAVAGPGSPAPAFEAHDLNGRPVSLDDFEGRVVLLNIWATWCYPCRVEMPSMQRLYDEYRGTDFEIVAVSIDAANGASDDMDRPGGDIGAFADSLDLSFRILHDPTGRIQEVYQTTGVPESFLIGRDGVIHRRVLGATEWDTPENRQLVERLLEQGA